MKTIESFLTRLFHLNGLNVAESTIREEAVALQKQLIKDAQGDELPEIDREVIVFVQQKHTNPESIRVAFGHRPDPKGWDGRSLTTGKVEHFDVQVYDHGGWNQPNVKYWLDLDIPSLKQ